MVGGVLCSCSRFGGFLFVVTFVFILIKLVVGGVEGITYHRVLGTPCQVSPPETMKI